MFFLSYGFGFGILAFTPSTPKSKMYYSAQEAESEINTEIKNNNARVLSVTAVGECVLVVYEMPA